MGNTKKDGISSKKPASSADMSKAGGGTKNSKPDNKNRSQATDTSSQTQSDNITEKQPDYNYKRIQYALDGTYHLLGDEELKPKLMYHGQQKTDIQCNHEYLQSQLTVNPADLALPPGSDTNQNELLKAKAKFHEWNQYIDGGGQQGQPRKGTGS